LFVRREVFLVPALNYRESYSLRFKQGKLQCTIKNYILLSMCVCCKLLAVVAAAGVAALEVGDVI